MPRCVFVIGTRAQLVKVAPVLARAVASDLDHVAWFTGQHEESIDDLIDDFAIQSLFERPPERKERSSILRLLGWFPGTLWRCRRYLRSLARQTGHKPVVVVHGDTLSTLLGAVAAKLAGAELVHLESGLSSGSIADPFPEELLRRLTFRLIDVALCPNDAACDRMRRFPGCRTVHTGENTLLDCVRLALESRDNTGAAPVGDYFAASIHRFQNIYRRNELSIIVDELIELSELGPVHFILHPPTELRLRKYGLYARLADAANIHLRPRMPYTEFVALIAASRGVLSDGGSNQEELSYLGVPTVLYRGRSERPDGLGANVVLRSEIGTSLAGYARSGELDGLRRPSRVHVDAQPSRIAVDVLARIVTGAALEESTA